MEDLAGRLVSTRTADGVLLHGFMTGEGGRRGVLAVHGAWGNFYATPVADLLRAAPEYGLTALSMNTRGHDLGTLGDGEPCIGFMRDRFEWSALDLDTAAGVLLDLGVERFVVVGHSYSTAKVAAWLAGGGGGDSVRAAVFASPATGLAEAARWFVEGEVDDHFGRARAAVDAGRPHQLVVLSSSAPVPMVAEAATVLSTWANPLADASPHVRRLRLPILVTIGRREPSAYRAKADEVVAAAADGTLAELDDDHYYARARSAFTDTVLRWCMPHLGADKIRGTRSAT